MENLQTKQKDATQTVTGATLTNFKICFWNSLFRQEMTSCFSDWKNMRKFFPAKQISNKYCL